ncbi:hypothetical protein SOCE26_098620 [Sorangium cellulosum]|uniref:Secreted protein n=1 Tax=Sorangium cellulosum TaxID=56 RepID=A0A2L0F9R4_SORCE|nr:hypothetical protein [Sorangium cellulosum]AUX48328.1 hypothetical protein SOCE26_098620 [Sorangium cellulosum]
MRTLSLRMASLLLLALAPLALQGAACSAEDGTTPTCTNNVDADAGVLKDPDGCHQFPSCVVNGKLAAPEECCKNSEGLVNRECVNGYAPLSGAASTTSSAGSGGGGGDGGGGSSGDGGGGGSGDGGGGGSGDGGNGGGGSGG